MLCAVLNHQLRHCVLSRPLIHFTQCQSAKRSQKASDNCNDISSHSHQILSASWRLRSNLINKNSNLKSNLRFYPENNIHTKSQNFLTTPSLCHSYQGNKPSASVSRITQIPNSGLSLSETGHHLSRNKVLHFPHSSTGLQCNVLHTKPPGSTEYTRGAINIPKLILDASPTVVQPYLEMIRFDRPIGTWLLYWPCTWSIALAAQPGCWPDFYMIALFGAGAFFMRGAGCIINDMWDKDFDNKVERTRGRPLTSGKVTFPQAVVFLGSQLAISLAILMQLNWYSIYLGAASIGIVITYPAFKRFTYWPQIVLGFAFNYGALLGWAAIRGSCDWSIVLPLYFLCHMWTMVYDTIYAHQDKMDDLMIGVKSTALRFGDQTKPWLAGFTTLMAGGLLYVGHAMDMTWPFYTGSTIAIASIVRQLYRLDIDNPQACGDAFRFHFYIGLLMFVTIMMGNLAKPKKDGESTTKAEESASPPPLL